MPPPPLRVFFLQQQKGTKSSGETRKRVCVWRSPVLRVALPSGSRCPHVGQFAALSLPAWTLRPDGVGKAWRLPREGAGPWLHCGAWVENVGRSCLGHWGTPRHPCGPREAVQCTQAAGSPIPPIALLWLALETGVFVPLNRDTQELPRASVDVCKRLLIPRGAEARPGVYFQGSSGNTVFSL